MRFVFKLIFRVGLSFGSIGLHGAVESWTSADGRLIEAEILSTDDTKVKMIRTDGVEFEAPIKLFSPADQERIRSWTPPPLQVLEPAEAVFTVATKEGRGTAFLLQHENKVWLYTNIHVIGAADSLEFTNTKGERLQTSSFQIATDRDLARFEVEYDGGLKAAPGIKFGDKITVLGNSRGSGHISKDSGKIVAISVDEVEVDADIVAGNSGGPILNEANEVVGVSSYVTFSDFFDPTIAGTRFVKPRRFGLRVDSKISFKKISAEAFQQAHSTYLEAVTTNNEAIQTIYAVNQNPNLLIPIGKFQDSRIDRAARRYNRRVKSGLTYKDIFDLYDDLAKTSERSISSAIENLDAKIFGWMLKDLNARQEHIVAMREMIDSLSKTYR